MSWLPWRWPRGSISFACRFCHANAGPWRWRSEYGKALAFDAYSRADRRLHTPGCPQRRARDVL